jgi:chromosome segregation ATPase
MNHYVVNTYDEAIAAINLLSKSAKGRAQFFILNNYSLTPKPLSKREGLKRGFKRGYPCPIGY